MYKKKNFKILAPSKIKKKWSIKTKVKIMSQQNIQLIIKIGGENNQA